MAKKAKACSLQKSILRNQGWQPGFGTKGGHLRAALFGKGNAYQEGCKRDEERRPVANFVKLFEDLAKLRPGGENAF